MCVCVCVCVRVCVRIRVVRACTLPVAVPRLRSLPDRGKERNSELQIFFQTVAANLHTRGAGEVCRGFDRAGLVLTSFEVLSLSLSLPLSLSSSLTLSLSHSLVPQGA